MGFTAVSLLARLMLVFVHLLPGLREGSEANQETLGGMLGCVEHHAPLLALLGHAVFCALNRLAKTREGEHVEEGGEENASPAPLLSGRTSA